MNVDQYSGREPWLSALDAAVDARDRLRGACAVDPAGSQARLARHDLAVAFGRLSDGLATTLRSEPA